MIRRSLLRAWLRFSARSAVITLVLTVLTALLLLGSLMPALAQEPLEPQAPPDAHNGLPLFADRCANCHGPSGKGDGEMSDNLAAPPRDFSDTTFRRRAVPSVMFQTITDGRLDAGMPPFGPASTNAIAVDDRWDLIAAIYSLGTPPEALENGRVLYEENCLACHGDNGAGDDPQASGSSAEIPDLALNRYWTNRSNEMVFATLQNGEIVDHTYALGEDDLWDVVDYARTFSYIHADPQELTKPIANALITGHVINATTEELISDGTVTLRAFTPELQEALSLTTDLDPDGRYSFEIADAGPDWVYMSSIDHGDLSFSSNPERLDRNNAQAELPISVYDTTDDPTVVTINQVHMILDIVDDRVRVSEIYVLSNGEPAVYVGESGVPDDGTIKLALPSGAENVEFQRSFSSFENFLPAPEVIVTGEGYADTVPVRPGDGAMNLLASYELPFEAGMTIGHPIFYETNSASIVLPDIGIEIEGDRWASQGAQQMGSAGSILSYSRPGLAAGEAVSFALQGRPVVSRAGSAGSAGDNSAAILLGGFVLLLAAGGAAYTVRNWQSAADEAVAEQAYRVDDLLTTIANLDEAYEAGDLDTEKYEQRRADAMEDLAAIWRNS